MSHREIEMGRLQTVIGEARQLGGPAGKMAVALVEVVGTCHEWNTTSTEVAGGAIPLNDAINQILDAVQRGLDSPPKLLPAGATPMMITDDIALNMAAAVLDVMGHEEVAAGLRLLLPKAEGKVQGQPYQEQTGKWGRPGTQPRVLHKLCRPCGDGKHRQCERYRDMPGEPWCDCRDGEHRRIAEAGPPAGTGAAMPSEGGQPAFFSERPDGKPWGAPTGQPEAEAVLAVKVSDDGRVKFMLGAPALRPGIYEGTIALTEPAVTLTDPRPTGETT